DGHSRVSIEGTRSIWNARDQSLPVTHVIQQSHSHYSPKAAHDKKLARCFRTEPAAHRTMQETDANGISKLHFAWFAICLTIIQSSESSKRSLLFFLKLSVKRST